MSQGNLALAALARAGAERPAGEAETYARLEAQVPTLALRQCNGCTACATRCTDHIPLTYPEFARLVTRLAQLPPDDTARVLAQDKRLDWGMGCVTDVCPFLDREADRCLVYEARPLICRLFGIVPWLPCPRGESVPVLEEGVGILRAYADLERRPLWEWLHQTGIALPGLREGE